MRSALFFLAAQAAAAAGGCNFTYAPSAHSLADARGALAAHLRMTNGRLDADLTLCLLPGDHSVAAASHALHGAAHGVRAGTGRVIWRGLGAGARVTGGAQVTGWAPATLGGGAVFAAAVPPAVAAAGTVVRQLWVAGARAARTVLSNPAAFLQGLSLWEGAGTIGYTAGSVPPAWLNHTTSLEFVYPIVLQNWVSPRCTVAALSVAPPAPPGPISGPLPDTSTISHSNLNPGGNVSGSIEYAGVFDSPAACAAACVAAARCTSYTYHDATVTAGFAKQCYFRVDGVWAPEGGWAGHWSGSKSAPPAANFTLAAPCGAFLLTHGRANPVTIEAAPIFPLQPGVFFHDAGQRTLYYALAPNQTAADLEADAFVAAQDVLLEAVNVSGHAYENVEFVYGSWGQANSADGYVDEQAAVYACTPGGSPACPAAAAALARRPGTLARDAAVPMGNAEPRGNVRVSGGANNSFAGCTFAHLGAAYALSMMEGTQFSTVFNNTFYDLSGGFLKLGSVGTGAAGSADPAAWDAFASVTHNTAEDLANEYDGAVGYFGGFLFSADVSHNTVSDAGYSGFSAGWGWGTLFPVGVGNSSITYNRISNVMRLLRDGGGIYVNGAENKDYESVMAHNYVTDDEAVFAVLYLDNGASYWSVHDNVVTASPQAWAFFMTGGANLPAKNNHMAALYWNSSSVQPGRNECSNFNCTTDDATIVAVTGPWPMAAQAIIDASGAQVY